jgi:hypothetical protein
MTKRIVPALLMAALTFGMTVIGCDDGSTGEEKKKTPSSVDDYSKLEPAMAANPSRAMARAGGTAQIGIPGYLLPSREQNARAAGDVTATFKVHEDDSSIAEIVSQNGSTCKVKGLKLGSARIIVTVGGSSATIVIAVAPKEDLYTLPAGEVKTLGNSSFYNAWWNDIRPDTLPSDYENYTSEPSYQLAWNWRNPSQSYGLSGTPCGIDVLAYFVDPVVTDRRGWVRTTYGFGGWHYDLNGQTNTMTNGVQVNDDVKLELKPEFVYDKGVPYLQITHTLTNTGDSKLTGQKFGASADVMLFNMDSAPLTYLPYGALMTNGYGTTYLPTMKIRLVCQGLPGVNNASTIWMGTYGGERNYVYEDQREDISGTDTALNFSYQDISLNPGESKKFVMRFTQVQ